MSSSAVSTLPVRSRIVRIITSSVDDAIKPLISRRLFTGGLVAAAFAGVFNPLSFDSAFAEPTSAEKQAEADEVQRKLDAWAVELDQATTNYYLAIEAHDDAVTAMEEAQGRISAAEGEVTRLQERLGTRATSMYKQGKLSFFEVLFGAHTFTEFTSSWDLLNSINNEDAVLIQQSRTAKQDAQAAHDDYLIQEQIAEQKLDEANEIRAQAEETVLPPRRNSLRSSRRSPTSFKRRRRRRSAASGKPRPRPWRPITAEAAEAPGATASPASRAIPSVSSSRPPSRVSAVPTSGGRLAPIPLIVPD
jgi:hypothetical protein